MEKNNLYKSINLNVPFFKDYITPEKELKNLSKINIFIGPNNTGKSRFLRTMFSVKGIQFTTEIVDLAVINSIILSCKKEIQNLLIKHNVSSIDGLNHEKLNEIKFVGSSIDLKNNSIEAIRQLTQPVLRNPKVLNNSRGLSVSVLRYIGEQLDVIVKECVAKFEFLESFDQKSIERKRIYIPTLRGLRNIAYDKDHKLSDLDNYTIRTKEDYFDNAPEITDRIFTGLTLYNDIKRLLLGSGNDRQKIRNFEDFLKRTFFNNADFNIIPHIDDNAVHVKIGEIERPIYELGDGIQSIIILTYPLFFNQGENMNVFYEEPDQYLHPGFQRIFLETLMLPEFDSFQFFLTTHSNHFLDMTLDFNKISVYSFQKKNENFVIENVENDHKNLLEMLGVRNSSVYLSNCTIWVEGITDRIYIRKFLEIFQKDKLAFHEDIHYSFVEYGGGNITHWSFLENSDESHPNINIDKLCGKLFLVSDNDNAGFNKDGSKSKKLERHEKLKEKLGEQYCCLKSIEIENLLSENTIKKVIEEVEGNTSSIDFSKLKLEKYSSKHLGKFIDTHITGLKKTYASESGTIKDKVNFSKIAVSYIENQSDLTEEATALAQAIYNFIKKNN